MDAKVERRSSGFVRQIPGNWWLLKRSYTLFMFRELSSGVLALYAILLVRLLHRAHDPALFGELFQKLISPVSIVLHVIVLGFALLNTVTTFTLAPRVLKLYRGEEKVPEALISGVHYAAWAVVTLVLFVIAWRL